MAALLAQLEQDAAPAAEPPPVAPAPSEPEPVGVESAADTDAELATLLAQLETDAVPPAETPVVAAAPAAAATSAEPVTPEQQIEALGGGAALEALGWPLFVPAFAEDLQRQLDILQWGSRNALVEKTVRSLVKKLGGYAALRRHGVTAALGLNAQLERLLPLKAERDRAAVLTDANLIAMAGAYRADLAVQADDHARIELLLQVKDYDRWACLPRNEEHAAKLTRLPFAEKRQAQLQHQHVALGGAAAWQEAVAAGAVDGAAVEHQVGQLKMWREFVRLGGEAAYAARARGSGAGAATLDEKLRQLKAILAAQES